MGRIREEDYAYATARVRAVEVRLMDDNKINRLLNMTDPQDAVKFLLESGYGADHTDSEKKAAENIEVLFDDELKNTYNFLLEILPSPEPVYLFMRRYDYLNAKLILKAEFLGVNVLERLSHLGTIEPEKLHEYITDRNFDELPEIFSEAIHESIEAFNLTRDPQVIDLILDKASYQNMLSDAMRYEDPFLTKLVKKLIDTANIRIIIRTELLGQPEEFIKKALIEGGNFPVGGSQEFSGQNREKLLQILNEAGLEKLSLKLAKAFENNHGISEIEKILDDYVISYFKPSKFAILGLDPVIAYLFLKETEIKNLRLIITGMVNKIPAEAIRERLRMSYA
ncbi:MAG: V-type ATP synthase subunit C [Clostridiaceae bacterium]|nr:V-type ATP synthase subunit C [Clostridiaceae bacterium]